MPFEPVIRPATASDEGAVIELCESIWPGEDHVPYYWHTYHENPHTFPCAVEIGGRVAALAFLDIENAEGWWHGLRVSPAFRQRGLATLLLEHAIGECSRRGASTLRYSSSPDNEFMLRLAERKGFRVVSVFRHLCAGALSEAKGPGVPTAVRPLRMHDLDRLVDFLHSTSGWNGGYRARCDAGTWRGASRDALRALIAHGWAYGCFNGERIEGAALTSQEREEAYRWFFLSRIDGTPVSIEALGLYLRRLVPTVKGESDEEFPLSGMVQEDPAVLEPLARAGFSRFPDGDMRLFERSL